MQRGLSRASSYVFPYGKNFVMKKLFLILILSALILPSRSNAQGCVETSGDEAITIIGFLQPEFRYDFFGEDAAGKSLDQSSLYFNRARLGVAGNIPYDFNYYLMVELSPTINGAKTSTAPFLLDAFIGYNRFAPYLKASFGQFKAPFGIELPTPCHKLHTIRRSLVVEQLVHPWRDLTFMIYGSTGKLNLFGTKVENQIGYNLALTNGTGIFNGRLTGGTDDNNKRDLIGRLTIHPVEFITLGASYRFGKQPPKATTVTEDDERNRFGFDVELKYKNFLVQGEFVQGKDIGSYTVGGGCGGDVEVKEGTKSRNGFFAQAAYMTPWKIQPVIKFETFDPDLDLDAPTTIEEAIENTTTFGFNYFFNDRTRVQINYLYNAEENGDVEIPNDAILVQFQISFN
jgi:hypothetical protein